MDLILFFNELVDKLKLGDLLSEPTRVTGGLMHKMYKLNTKSGVYIVKLLSPDIMNRSNALDNFSQADRLEIILENNNIPIIPALVFNNKKMQQLASQYFYVYEWNNGSIVNDNEITKMHCRKISKVLSRIHNIDFKEKTFKKSEICIDWDYYIDLAHEQNLLIYNLLSSTKEILYKSQSIGNKAIYNVAHYSAICHNDMDCKNVLWSDKNFRIIDLECLSYSNPYIELFELALCWSGYNIYDINFDLFASFISAYFENTTKPKINWESIYYCNNARLEWLEYNIKRALLIECDSPETQQNGIKQAKKTIKQIIYYNRTKDKILDCLNKI